MATIALAAVAGSFEAGSLVMGLSVALGSVLDQTLVLPTLFPGDPIEAGRVEDMQLSAAKEGAATFLAVGRRVKVPMVLTWVGPMVEIQQSNSVGKNQSVVNYKYRVDCVFELCRNLVNDVPKIWFDGDLVYDDEPLSLTVVHNVVPSLQLAGISTRARLITKKSEFDLTQFTVGSDIVCTNFTNAVNNGTFEIVLTHEWDIGGTTYTRMDFFNTGWIAEPNPPSNATVNQTATAWEPGIAAGGQTFRYGTDVETPPTTQIVHEGSAIPANRRKATLTINSLNMQKWGQRIPNGESLIEPDSNATLEDVFTAIFTDAGLASSEYDVSTLTEEVQGYAIPGPQPLIQAIQPLLLTHDLILQETAGVLVFKKRSALSEITVNREELDARDFGAHPSGRYIVQQGDKLARPGKVNLTFINLDAAYSEGSVNATSANPNDETIQSINLPLVISPADAREIANRSLWRLRVDIDRYTCILPPKYCHAQQGDYILTEDAEGFPLRLLINEALRDPYTLRTHCSTTLVQTFGIDYSLAAVA